MAEEQKEPQLNIDSIIERLLAVHADLSKPKERDFVLTVEECKVLCETAQTILEKEPSLLELNFPIIVAGDVRGHYPSLRRIFEIGGHPNHKFLFLGNYVDKGRNSLETISLLLAYKVKHPDQVYLLRGNHEIAAINRVYKFYDECKYIMGSAKEGIKVWKAFNKCFNYLPIAAVLNQSVFCARGGMSPELHSFDQIRQITRPTDVADHGLICDLLWSEPSKEKSGWSEDSWRKISYEFGTDVVFEFIRKFKLALILRCNLVESGYFADNKVLSIHAYPHYFGEEHFPGTIVFFDEAGTISVKEFGFDIETSL